MSSRCTRALMLVTLVLALAACGTSSTVPSTPPTPTATSTPTPTPIAWQAGAISIFHSNGGNYQGANGLPYTDAFTVPAVWRVKWFCMASSDPTQADFAFDVQHAGEVSNADGETPLQVDCNQHPYGTTIEHVGGSVTLELLAGTGTSFDAYVQIPK